MRFHVSPAFYTIVFFLFLASLIAFNMSAKRDAPEDFRAALQEADDKQCFFYGKMEAGARLIEKAFPENGEIDADFLQHTANCDAAIVARGAMDGLLDAAARDIRERWEERRDERPAP